jgi:Gpi18-like mannosyltransferase
MPARWDTGWYLGVAIDGYSFERTADVRQQNIAFFPLYPMLLRYLSPFAGHQYLWVGVAISFVAFLWAIVYLYRLARRYVDESAARAGVALLAAYPFALFYSTAYTEALFLLTIVAACYHFERDELWKAGAWGLAAGLSRPNGCLLSVVLALMAVRDVRTKPWAASADRIAAAAAPGIGMLIYSTYIFFLTGNPLQWTAQNAAWGRVYRGIDALVSDRYLYIQNNGFYNYASTLGLDLITAVAVVFVLASVWPVYRRFGLPYAVLLLVNVLPPLSLGGLLSMGRVTSVLFPAFLWLGAAIPERQRDSWLIGFAMMQGLCAIAFFTWRPLY